MRPARILLLAAAAAAGCSREPRRAFAVGLLEPVSAHVSAAARGLGLDVAASAPTGAAALSAASALPGGGETTADHARLRFLAARAIAEGASGVYWRLPSTPAGTDYIGYVEETQAVERCARELFAVRPVLEDGAPTAAPFAVSDGLELRAWTYSGRRYVLLVNVSGAARPVDTRVLVPWRALFAVRADARESLRACGTELCLPAEGVLWLEGRPLSGF